LIQNIDGNRRGMEKSQSGSTLLFYPFDGEYDIDTEYRREQEGNGEVPVRIIHAIF